jgi:uncharacterized protein YecA (UPF0149 family)
MGDPYRTAPVIISVPPGATEADIEALIAEATKGDYPGEMEVVRLCAPEERPELLCSLLTPTPPTPPPPVTHQPAGRNDPCPCGSGKKFKRCCKE